MAFEVYCDRQKTASIYCQNLCLLTFTNELCPSLLWQPVAVIIKHRYKERLNELIEVLTTGRNAAIYVNISTARKNAAIVNHLNHNICAFSSAFDRRYRINPPPPPPKNKNPKQPVLKPQFSFLQTCYKEPLTN